MPTASTPRVSSTQNHGLRWVDSCFASAYAAVAPTGAITAVSLDSTGTGAVTGRPAIARSTSARISAAVW